MCAVSVYGSNTIFCWQKWSQNSMQTVIRFILVSFMSSYIETVDAIFVKFYTCLKSKKLKGERRSNGSDRITNERLKGERNLPSKDGKAISPSRLPTPIDSIILAIFIAINAPTPFDLIWYRKRKEKSTTKVCVCVCMWCRLSINV